MEQSMWYQELRTPAAVIDLQVLSRNVAAMAERIKDLGARLRPHVKTHKCAEIARLQLPEDGGITVSTIAEARFFAGAGFKDITYAVPIGHGRIAEAAELATQVERLHLLVDHPHTVSAVDACARERQTRLSVLLKIDCGGGRAGVDPTSRSSLALAGQIDSSSWLELEGILTHAGHSYSCHDRKEIVSVARQERQVMVDLADKLAGSGIAVPTISIGSTPTMALCEELSGITEVRPGNYVFYDLHQAAIGVCSLTDIALSVLVSVVGSYPERKQVVIDAGAIALSKDPGPVHVDPQCGFGAVVPVDAEIEAGALRVTSLSQEHGVIRCSPRQAEELQPGTLLRILPNHSCLTAAMFDCYHVLDRETIVDIWRPVKGW
jgi:D-serine deaminase-like pyridoxal phosphate-dependent protein